MSDYVDLRSECRKALETKIVGLLAAGRLKTSWLIRSHAWHTVKVIVLPMRWYKVLDPTCESGFFCQRLEDPTFSMLIGVRNYTGYKREVTWEELHRVP